MPAIFVHAVEKRLQPLMAPVGNNNAPLVELKVVLTSCSNVSRLSAKASSATNWSELGGCCRYAVEIQREVDIIFVN